MIDARGRTIDYLRISITDRCNMRCGYCMPERLPDISHEEILRYEEILRICRCAVQTGIHCFKITGGEPLVRKGAVDFMGSLKKMPGVRRVTVTTNGFFLKEALPKLIRAGIDGINISLDSLDRAQFQALTGVDGRDRIMTALQAAVSTGIPTKINAVLLQETKHQIVPLSRLAQDMSVDVRFIELMPIGCGKTKKGLQEEEALSFLLSVYPDLRISGERRGKGPAVYYKSKFLRGRIGCIAANTHKFCSTCNRMRLTSTGFLKPCLCYDEGMDLKAILRSGGHEAERLIRAFRLAAERKPAGHCFDERDKITEWKTMNQIGG